MSTICYDITFLTLCFLSAKGVCKYVSGVRILQKELGVAPTALDNFPVDCLLWAVDVSHRVPLLRRLPILPHLLHQLCMLSTSLRDVSLAMRVCLTFSFFDMLRQSNLAPRSSAGFDNYHHKCRGDIIKATLGLLLVVQWTKTVQWEETTTLSPCFI